MEGNKDSLSSRMLEFPTSSGLVLVAASSAAAAAAASAAAAAAAALTVFSHGGDVRIIVRIVGK